MKIRAQGVLFVCLGNICRSPTAQGVFEHKVRERGLQDRIRVDSCGTSDWHVGEQPDPRTLKEAASRGYDLGACRGRQIEPADFDSFDYILAMDRANLRALEVLRPANHRGHLGLFLEFAPGTGEIEVPDPYHGGKAGFTRVMELVEAASDGLLDHLERARWRADEDQ